MSDEALDQRVNRLEELVMQVTYEHSKTEMELRSSSREMRDFKNEMGASKKENDRRWGDLVNKLGTLVEDIVAPSLPRIIKEDFGFGAIDDFMLNRRVRNRQQGTVSEFDTLIVSGDALFVNETKSKPKIEHVDNFMEKLGQLSHYLPDYADKTIFPLFSSLHIPESVVSYLTMNKIYALAMGEDVMKVLNLDDLGK